MCIISLDKIMPSSGFTHLCNFMTAIKQYQHQYLCDRISSAFIKLHSLQIYIKIISQNYYVHLSILWNNSFFNFQYKAKHIIIINLQVWFQFIMRITVHLLYKKLIFQSLEYLIICDLINFNNNMKWTINSKSFVNFKNNNLQEDEDWVLTWVKNQVNYKILALNIFMQIFSVSDKYIILFWCHSC